MLEAGQARGCRELKKLWEKYSGHMQQSIMFLKFRFNFGAKVGYVNDTETFYYRS